jgi:Domain of unknown function (DUF4383)
MPQRTKPRDASTSRRGKARMRAKDAAWPQAVAALVGVLFAIVGIVGFAATGLDGFVGRSPERLFGLAVNPLHNLVHFAVGVGGIVLSARLDRARLYGWLLAVAFFGLFGYGVLSSRVPDADVLNLNWPVNWLHLAFALVGVLIALGPVRRKDAVPQPREGC